MPGFSSSSKLLQKKWQERQHKLHVQKVQSMKAGLNNAPPKKCPHLVLRLKQFQKEEERQAQIDHNNKLLLQKMTQIIQSRGRLDNWNDYQTKSLNRQSRRDRLERIVDDNKGIAQRLQGVRPQYNVRGWVDDFEKRHSYLKEMWRSTTKDYDLTPREARYRRSNRGYESDPERHGRLPPIGSTAHSPGSSKDTSPRPDPSNHQPLPSVKQPINYGDTIAENDAKLIFRAIKGLVKPEDAVVRALIRRTMAQRLATRYKFEDLYDLNPVAEMKSVMGPDYHTLLTCLFADRLGAELQQIKTALQNNEPARVIECLSSRPAASVATINKAYSKRYSRTLTEEVEGGVLDEQCQTLLLTLLTEGRPMSTEVDEELAATDAQLLYESGEGRFTNETGQFMVIIRERNFPQIAETFTRYPQVSGGPTLAESMREDRCSAEFIEAVQVMGKCLMMAPEYWADKLHETIGPNNAEFINILLDRSEVNMAAIRKAYKTGHKVELVTDILNKTGKKAGPLIGHIAIKGAPHKAKDQLGPKRVNGLTLEGKPKKQPLTRGEVKPSPRHSQGQALGKTSTVRRVKPTSDFRHHQDDGAELERLNQAIQEIRLHMPALINILSERTHTERLQLAQKYSRKHHKDLVDVLQSELPRDYDEIIDGLLLPSIDYDVQYCFRTLEVDGVQDHTLIGLLATPAKDLGSLRVRYKETYSRDLVDDLRRAADVEDVPELGDLLSALLKGQSRDDSSTAAPVNQNIVKSDTRALITNIDKDGKCQMDVRGDPFRMVMTKRTHRHLVAVADEYNKMAGHTLEEGVRNANLGPAEGAYVAFVQASVDPDDFYARVIKEALANDDHKSLSQVIVTSQERNLSQIAARYKTLYNVRLADALDAESTSDGKDLLRTLVLRA